MNISAMSRPLYEVDPQIAAAIDNETRRQHEGLELIASENFVSEAVLEAAGSVFTNKYAEGYPGKRYYGGCEYADVVEDLARTRAKQLFNADHVNVQPHSGSEANADKVGAYLMVDMAHFAGLVAGGVHPSPVPHAHVVTTTTHKTLRGPRSGLILCHQELAVGIDRSVFPGQQGGPLMHIVAAKAVAFKEALEPEFATYAHQVVTNAKVLAEAIAAAGYRVVSGGTDTHVMLIDVFQKGMLGSEAEHALGEAGITVNKNAIPYDTNPPMKPSGIRIGTPALTTRGMKEPEMRVIAGWIAQALEHRTDAAKLRQIRGQVLEMAERFPLYGWLR